MHARTTSAPDAAGESERPKNGYLVNPVVEMSGAMIAAQLANVAARLGIADLLKDGPKTVAEVAGATSAHEPSLRRVLRGMACYGLLREAGPERDELTSLGTMLRSDSADQTRSLVMMSCDDSQWQSWGNLLHTVMTGETGFDHAFGMNSFEYYATRPEVAAEFHQTMAENTRAIVPGVLAAYPFDGYSTIVDVGGGSGTLLSEILKALPDTKGVLFDTEHGIRKAGSVLDFAGVADRCAVVAGDFFEAVPRGGDLYLLKDIVHDWDEDRVRRILSCCREALPAHGRLLLLEQMLPAVIDERAGFRTRATIMADLTMLVSTGGRERTETEFADLLTEAGFTLTGTYAVTASNYHLVEARPSTED